MTGPLAPSPLLTIVIATTQILPCYRSQNGKKKENGVISVVAALYGRADRETCSEGRPQQQLNNTECSQQGTVDLTVTIIILYGLTEPLNMCKYVLEKAAQLNNNQHPALLFYVCVSFRCDGKKVCELSVTDVESPDPCVDTYKYLETSYTCLPASQYHMTMKL
uniref:Uncharacterized protein n=1 Tax=Pundamilia nyererei TaxID=303518 RepID=A0A3B4GRZ8_9CICH